MRLWRFGSHMAMWTTGATTDGPHRIPACATFDLFFLPHHQCELFGLQDPRPVFTTGRQTNKKTKTGVHSLVLALWAEILCHSVDALLRIRASSRNVSVTSQWKHASLVKSSKWPQGALAFRRQAGQEGKNHSGTFFGLSSWLNLFIYQINVPHWNQL